MHYKRITPEDARFLTEIFSIPEYELYFAENDTTEEAGESGSVCSTTRSR